MGKNRAEQYWPSLVEGEGRSCILVPSGKSKDILIGKSLYPPCGVLRDGARTVVNTCSRNANGSCRVSKCALCPDTTCSTRPATRPRAISLSTRKCTTNAQWTDKGAFSAGCCGMLLPRSPYCERRYIPLNKMFICSEQQSLRLQLLPPYVRRIQIWRQKVLGKLWESSGISLGSVK